VLSQTWAPVIYCRSPLNFAPSVVSLPLRVWHCSQRNPVCREYTDHAAASRRGTINAAATRAAIITAEVPARTMFYAIVLLFGGRCLCIRETSPIALRPQRQA
jgi:hypothetical protein